MTVRSPVAERWMLLAHPCLRDHLRGLSDHLSYFIKHGQLPPQKLRVELLSRDELDSLLHREMHELVRRGFGNFATSNVIYML
jgi:hypothetical protein